jgi:hypothetical protein
METEGMNLRRLLPQMPLMELPAQVFFRPKPKFLDFMALRKYPIVDIGAGLGHFQWKMNQRHPKVPVVSIDIAMRDGPQGVGERSQVLIRDALEFSYKFNMCVVACRPSHDGWVYDAFKEALSRASWVFYVGLEKNVAEDLMDLRRHVVFRDAGEEGEHCWEVSLPRVKRHGR